MHTKYLLEYIQVKFRIPTTKYLFFDLIYYL